MTTKHEQELMDARARGYREALLDVHDAICSVVPPDERRAAISEVNALLADAMGE
jgi:hypothetical protein